MITYRFIFFCCLFASCAGKLAAQAEIPIYKGSRITLFDVKILQQNKNSIRLKCRAANTGRLPVRLDGKKPPPAAALLVELDTFSVPTMLQGRENLIAKAMRRQKLHLAPGAIRENIYLKIPLRKRKDATPGKPGGKLCADLVLDTAYVAEYTDKTMLLHFVIRNAGTISANLLGKSDKNVEDNVAVNVYFVSGTKLSRGAIYADGLFIRKGIETLDGTLQAGQALRGTLEISLKNRTRFSPNMVFELDPFQRVEECDRTNNTRAVVVEF